jgi:hypothetical protein
MKINYEKLDLQAIATDLKLLGFRIKRCDEYRFVAESLHSHISFDIDRPEFYSKRKETVVELNWSAIGSQSDNRIISRFIKNMNSAMWIKRQIERGRYNKKEKKL